MVILVFPPTSRHNIFKKPLDNSHRICIIYLGNIIPVYYNRKKWLGQVLLVIEGERNKKCNLINQSDIGKYKTRGDNKKGESAFNDEKPICPGGGEIF
jgi:hypothetical protein